MTRKPFGGIPPELGGLPGSDESRSALRDVVRELSEGTFRDIEEAQAFLDARMSAYNDRGQAGLGGLSPNQMIFLGDPDWFSGRGLRLATDLTLDDVSGSRFFFDVRTLLLALRDGGPAAATQAGNLSRAFTATMIELMRSEEYSREEMGRHSRVVNEADVWPLHISRLVGGLAGLIIRRKGFRISTRGKLLLHDDRAGELFAAIFNAYYRKLNLSYTDFLTEQPHLQSDIAFSLWVVRRMAREWVSVKELSQHVWRPELTIPSDREPSAWLNEGEWRTSTWLARPLEWFGLLEMRTIPGEGEYSERTEVRKTRLFDRFLRFQIVGDSG